MTQGYIVIPDLHGMKDLLDLVLKTYPGRQLLFLGDLLDRGPDSRGVIKAVRALVEEDRARLLMGNHEYMAVEGVRRFLADSEDIGLLLCWLQNGGDQVLAQYSPQDARAIADELFEDLRWIGLNAEAWIVEDGGLFTHAGRLPDWIVEGGAEEAKKILLADQPHLWSRPYVDELYPLPESISYSVHGHTPQANGKPLTIFDDEGKPAHYIDLGAVFHERSGGQFSNAVAVFDTATRETTVLVA